MKIKLRDATGQQIKEYCDSIKCDIGGNCRYCDNRKICDNIIIPPTGWNLDDEIEVTEE